MFILLAAAMVLAAVALLTRPLWWRSGRADAAGDAHDGAQAREQLLALRGKTHALHSAIALVRGGEVLFEKVAAAHLTMRAFSDDFLERYLDAVGEAATASVGGYQLEGQGVQLFEKIDGDHFTILGLPLLPLLGFLRSEGVVGF